MSIILPETLKDILTKSGFIAEEDFQAAAKTAKNLNQSITDVLVFRGLISEDALGKLIAEHFNVGFTSLRNKVIPLETLELIPEQAAIQYHAIPFMREENNVQIISQRARICRALRKHSQRIPGSSRQRLR